MFEGLIEFFEHLWSSTPSPLHVNYVLLGGFIALFGLVSLFVKEKLYLTESLVATLVGIAFGPYGAKIVIPDTWFSPHTHSFLREAARLVIGIQVMAAGVSVPGEFLRKNKLAIGMMLGPVMGVMWGISALCIKYSLSLDWCPSLIIAACVTPTDPVLAHSVIKGKFAERYIPTKLRHLLAVESGANDGLGFPFMMLPMWLILSATPSEALSHWFWHTWVWEIAVSVIVGYICGMGARFLLKASMKHRLIDKESFLVFTIALTLFVSGLVALMASDDLFAIFITGNVFAWDDKFLEATEDSHIAEVIDMLFNITFFVFFGALIPWNAFVQFGIMRLLLAAVLILLFRRLPVVMLMRRWIPTLSTRKEAFFAGWFGPMGVGAIFFAIQARDIILARHPHGSNPIYDSFVDIVYPVVAFIVLSSIFIHGITVPLTNSHLKRRMKRKVKRRARKNVVEESTATAKVSDLSPVTLESIGEMEESPFATSPSTEGGAGEDEYVYITDDEGEGEGDGEGVDGEGDASILDPSYSASNQSTVQRKRVKRRPPLLPITDPQV